MRKAAIIIAASILLILLLIAINVSAEGITPDEPLPGCSDNPACPKEWYVEQDFNGNTGYLVDDLEYPKWRIKAECQDPTKPAPIRGTYCIMTGSRKLDCEGPYQDLIALEVVDSPQETPTPTIPAATATPTVTPTPVVKPQSYINYVQWQFPFCVCTCYSAYVYIDGVFQIVIDLTEPNINYSDYFFNLYPGQNLVIVIGWCGHPANVDNYYEWSNVQINCDGKLPTTFDCPNGVCPPIECSDLNGYAECRVTITVKACPLCRGRFEGKDPYEKYIHEKVLHQL